MAPPTAQLSIPKPEGAEGGVIFGWICNGDVTNQMASSMLDFVIVDADRRMKEGKRPRISGKIAVVSSPRIVASRTDMVETFLMTDSEWLLTVDSDMSFSYETLDKLLKVADAKRRPIVGGLCFGGGRSNPDGPLNIFPTLYRLWTGEDGKLDSETVVDYPRDKLVEVSATGAAFMLVHRSVLLAMRETYGAGDNPYPYYGELVVRGKPMGEDVTFCIRAGTLGFKVFVHTGVKIAHEKRYYLTEELFDETRSKHA